MSFLKAIPFGAVYLVFLLILINVQVKLVPLFLERLPKNSIIKKKGGYVHYVDKIIQIDERLMDTERLILQFFNKDFFEEHLLMHSILSLGVVEYLLSYFDEGFRVEKTKDRSALHIEGDYFPNKSDYPSSQIKAIYLRGDSLHSKRLTRHIRYIKKNKMNAIVFDLKDVTGYVNFSILDSMVKKVQANISPVVSEPKKMIQRLREHKIHTIARIALFQDETLARALPELAIYKHNRQPLLVKGKKVWVDPARKKVQEYNLRLIWETIQTGVDEIQLDYVRYPAEGVWRKGKYYNLQSHSDKPNIITQFLQNVHSLTSSYGIVLSIDVFGVVAWGEKVDIKSTGQNLKLLSQAVDVISPMVYPSHYGNLFHTIKDPSNSPYRIVKMSCQRLKKLLNGSNVSIRPWLQAFSWRVQKYGSQYIEAQIKAGQVSGAEGYMLWNAKNQYIPYNHPDT